MKITNLAFLACCHVLWAEDPSLQILLDHGRIPECQQRVEANDFATAEQSLREAARLEPKNPKILRMQADFFLFEGHRDTAKALVFAQTCLTQDATFPSGLAAMAKVLPYQEKWAELTAWLSHSLMARPGDYGQHLAAASSLNDLSRSEPLYRQILTAPVGSYAYRTWNVHFEYGKSLKKAGRMEDAVSHFEKAVALNNAAWVVWELKDAKKRAGKSS